MQAEERTQTLSKQPVIDTEKPKEGKYPDGGFEKENFFPGKKLPKPDIRKYGDQESREWAGMRPVYRVPIVKAPKMRDYGKDSPDLELLVDRYLSELQKYLKGKNIKAGIVFMPYSRN
jgi:hypothetical protein